MTRATITLIGAWVFLVFVVGDLVVRHSIGGLIDLGFASLFKLKSIYDYRQEEMKKRV